MKLKSVAFIVIVLAFSTFAQKSNWNGYLDTATIKDSLGVDDYYETTSFLLSHGLNIRAVVLAKDTTDSGFASDELEFDWGYEVGTPVLDSNSILDTAWHGRIFLDKFDMDSIGIIPTATTDSNGVIAMRLGRMDTLSVAGFTVQSANYSPPWAVLVKYWLKGNTGVDTDTLEVRFMHTNRYAFPVKQK